MRVVNIFIKPQDFRNILTGINKFDVQNLDLSVGDFVKFHEALGDVVLDRTIDVQVRFTQEFDDYIIFNW